MHLLFAKFVGGRRVVSRRWLAGRAFYSPNSRLAVGLLPRPLEGSRADPNPTNILANIQKERMITARRHMMCALNTCIGPTIVIRVLHVYAVDLSVCCVRCATVTLTLIYSQPLPLDTCNLVATITRHGSQQLCMKDVSTATAVVT